jgi:hypothetical protein
LQEWPLTLNARRHSCKLDEGESFHTEIMTKGRVLYEKEHARMGAQSGR